MKTVLSFRDLPRPQSLTGIEWNVLSGWEQDSAGFAVTTFFITALDASANLFGHFFNEKRGAAGRTGLVDRTIPHGIFTGRIFAAGKKCPRAFLGALLNKIATAAWLWAFHAQRKRLGRLTFRVRRTGNELAKSSGLHHHRTAAFLALLIRR